MCHAQLPLSFAFESYLQGYAATTTAKILPNLLYSIL